MQSSTTIIRLKCLCGNLQVLRPRKTQPWTVVFIAPTSHEIENIRFVFAYLIPLAFLAWASVHLNCLRARRYSYNYNYSNAVKHIKTKHRLKRELLANNLYQHTPLHLNPLVILQSTIWTSIDIISALRYRHTVYSVRSPERGICRIVLCYYLNMTNHSISMTCLKFIRTKITRHHRRSHPFIFS